MEERKLSPRGGRAPGRRRQLGKRLVRGHPMLEAEVVYAINEEYCRTAQDFLARRTRLAFLDTRAALEALPRVGGEALKIPSSLEFRPFPSMNSIFSPQVVELMGAELKWSRSRKRSEIRNAKKFLDTFQCHV